ncbi:MAG: GtrA family protein [Candidatus Fournierella pullistercoris]|uniref:GtrA family protein n=1 Tax=Candidatus Allofournierella pullistercoris TaxID=2838597 RepID=A0A948T2K7_9FIRM|nr:GtrA family protein [Candidatus Fournierella pullistercoris]
MTGVKKWIDAHPDLWEFILFNILSNCATVTNFVVMWICTGFVFTSFANQPFQFFIFNYTNVESDLGLCGFLSFLVATAAAQTVNFFVQKNWVFKSNAAFGKAVPKYVVLAVVLVIISAALPAYSQSFFLGLGVPQGFAPTLANIVNIVVQVVISYPAMKFFIMPKNG